MPIICNLCYITEIGSKVGYFTDFCHQCLATISMHTNAHHNALFESETTIGL